MPITVIVTWLATSIIRLLQFLLVARAILSWIPQAQGSKLAEILYDLTEPMIIPFRSLLNRFDIIRMFPLDISFLCVFIVLEFIQKLLLF